MLTQSDTQFTFSRLHVWENLLSLYFSAILDFYVFIIFYKQEGEQNSELNTEHRLICLKKDLKNVERYCPFEMTSRGTVCSLGETSSHTQPLCAPWLWHSGAGGCHQGPHQHPLLTSHPPPEYLKSYLCVKSCTTIPHNMVQRLLTALLLGNQMFWGTSSLLKS